MSISYYWVQTLSLDDPPEIVQAIERNGIVEYYFYGNDYPESETWFNSYYTIIDQIFLEKS
jgi:hypothetical protein